MSEYTSTARTQAEARALEMWPERLHLGKWDGIKIDAERALLIQRQAFAMGAQWALDEREGGE